MLGMGSQELNRLIMELDTNKTGSISITDFEKIVFGSS